VSVGHVQRAIETAGLPTVGIYVRSFGRVPELMGVARALITPNPMGRPLGAPNDPKRQLEIVRSALGLLNTAGPSIVEFDQPYRVPPR